MIDLLAYFDLSALRKIARFSFEHIELHINAKDTSTESFTYRLLKMNRSLDIFEEANT